MRNQRLRTAPDSPTPSWIEARVERSKAKRIAHGGIAWSLPDAQGRLKQPQDGAREAAEDGEARMDRHPAREPEDARMTGGTRSLMRRVMGLNVTARPGRKPVRPAVVADAHAHVA